MGLFAFKRKREQEAAKVASVPLKTKKVKKIKVNGDHNRRNTIKRNSK
ncbi:MAG: hypothetical protein Unbinned1007contig1000_38 [Prokaryotic dsDNA virus sp.]|nr:MAG: hypothetical protein Unbinned1007contig1000_38 [Prokaryotic dsDNA virus sp.]